MRIAVRCPLANAIQTKFIFASVRESKVLSIIPCVLHVGSIEVRRAAPAYKREPAAVVNL
jgi:hypothetical protein